MYYSVAFVGFKACGKNTAAEPLIKDYGYASFSFADALKDCLAAIFCWDRNLLTGVTSESRQWREQVDPWWADKLSIPHFTPRFAMENIGTEVMRKHFNWDLWVLNVERRIMRLSSQPVALTDARFPNEIKLLRRYGGQIIRIRRGRDPNWVSTAISANAGCSTSRAMMHFTGVHESEWAWLGVPVDATIENDGSIEQLHAKMADWVSITKRLS